MDDKLIQAADAQQSVRTTGVNRRAFLSGTAAGALGGGAIVYGVSTVGIPPAVPLNIEPAQGRDVASDSTHSPQAASRPDLSSDARSHMADLILESIRRRYPSEHLDDVALSAIRKHVTDQLRRSAVLSRFPLVGDDRPAPTFAPVASHRVERQ